MGDKLCGLCFGSFENLKQHLLALHRIPNRQEFGLLIKYGNARTAGRLDCKICSKKELIRLDKHLIETHRILSADEREPIMKQAKRAVIVKKIAALRETNPQIPIVSTLDMGITNEYEDFVPPIGDLSEEPTDQEESEKDDNDVDLCLPLTTDSSSSNDCPSTGIEYSSDLYRAPSQPLPYTPVTGPSGSPFSNIAMTVQPHSNPLRGSMSSVASESWSSPSNLPGQLSGRSDESTGSLSKTCECKFENLSPRLQYLEQRLNSLLESQTSTPKTTPRKSCRLAQKGERVTKTKIDTFLYEKIVKDFESFRLGARTGRKDRDNAKQSFNHARRFCLYMADGLPLTSISGDIRFLNQMDKLRTWPTDLAQKGYVATTVKNMMINVIMFFKHVENSFQGVSKLTPKDLTRILYELKRAQAEVQRKVVTHRQKVVRHKTDDQLTAAQATAFMTAARQKIPELFVSIACSGNVHNLHAMVMGYMMGYLAMLTGHRAVVFTNLTKENVINCRRWKNGRRYNILVDDHKTVRSFGEAAFNLNKEEYCWLSILCEGKCCQQCEGSEYVFHTTSGRQMQKPVHHLNLAWVDAGMEGEVTFNKIRSSVSTQANQYLSEKDRKQVAKAMCHDPSTAERFYVALPDKSAGYEVRRMRLEALQMAASREDADADECLETCSDDSSEAEEPICNDTESSPESSCSPTEEEVRVWLKKKSKKSKRAQLRLHIAPLPKCEVVVKKLAKNVVESYIEKIKAAAEEERRRASQPVDMAAAEEEGRCAPQPVDMAAAEEESRCAPQPVDMAAAKAVCRCAPQPVDMSAVKEERRCAPQPVDMSAVKEERRCAPQPVDMSAVEEEPRCAPQPVDMTELAPPSQILQMEEPVCMEETASVSVPRQTEDYKEAPLAEQNVVYITCEPEPTVTTDSVPEAAAEKQPRCAPQPVDMTDLAPPSPIRQMEESVCMEETAEENPC